MSIARRRAPLQSVIAAAALLMTGCAADPSPTTSLPVSTVEPVPSLGPAPTASPTVAPTSTAAPSPEALEPDAIGQVVTSNLVVRTLPEISEASRILDPLLEAPTLLFVVAGPVAANGYEWYQVQPFGIHYLEFMTAPPPFGWVAAASREGEPWVAPASLDCPTVELAAIHEMSGEARLACYRGVEIQLEGVFAGCFVADPAVVTPEWLTSTGCGIVPPDYRADVLPNPGLFAVRTDGALDFPHDRPDATVAVTGHFDDPAAASCVQHPDVGDETGLTIERREPAQVVLDCRTQFVATSVETLP